MTEPTGAVIVLPEGYRPGEDEDYMNPLMREYFRQKLLEWKADILNESRSTIGQLRDDNAILPDMIDRAASETGKALELRTRDRQRKLISKIDAALRRIDSDDYGWCEETGDPIGVARLEARPTATLCLEAQERHERSERVHRDD